MTNKEKILFVLILVFLTTLFFPRFRLLDILAAMLLVLYAVFFNSWKEKWQLLKERKHLLWMFAFFIMVAISVLLSANFHKGLRYLDPRLPLLYFPASIGLLELRKRFREKVLLAFAWLTTVVVFLCFCWALNRSAFFKKPEFLYNDSLTEILGQQSIYISLLVNLAIYVFCYHIFYKKSRGRGWMLVASLFLFAISYFLASRVMIVMMFSSILAFAFYNVILKKKYSTGIALVLGLVVGVFLIFKVFPKTLNRFKELAFTQFNYESMGSESHYNTEVTKQQWNGINFRMAVWQCGWELFLAHPVKGVDIGDKKDALMDKYREKKFQFALQTGKNVHSNYIDILYSMGIIGLSLFLIGWIILPLMYAKQNGDWLIILMILTFAAAWVSEIYFDRSIGGMLTGFFISFLLTGRKPASRAVGEK